MLFKRKLFLGLFLFAVGSLVSMEKRPDCLIDAIKRRGPDRVKAVKQLLADDAIKATVNMPDNNGSTALMKALGNYEREDGLALVRLLLDFGADPRIAPTGFTPLMLAAHEASLETIQLLCERGALETIRQVHQGKTALNYGCPTINWNPYGRVKYFLEQCPELASLGQEVSLKRLVVFNNPVTLEYLLAKKNDWKEENLKEALAYAHDRWEIKMAGLLKIALESNKK